MRVIDWSRGSASLVIAGLLASACATPHSVVAARFAYDYNCPGVDLKLRSLNAANTFYEVTGCGTTRTYTCYHPVVMDSDAATPWTESDCQEMKPEVSTTYRATDGTTYLEVQPEDRKAIRKAAFASAAHDLPCPLGSLSGFPSAELIVEGCGERVTYQLVGPDLPAPSADNRAMQFEQLVLIGRVAQTR